MCKDCECLECSNGGKLVNIKKCGVCNKLIEGNEYTCQECFDKLMKKDSNKIIAIVNAAEKGLPELPKRLSEACEQCGKLHYNGKKLCIDCELANKAKLEIAVALENTKGTMIDATEPLRILKEELEKAEESTIEYADKLGELIQVEVRLISGNILHLEMPGTYLANLMKKFEEKSFEIVTSGDYGFSINMAYVTSVIWRV